MQFWDTSTLLKLYVAEPDSSQFVAHADPAGIAASELCRCELLRALARKESEGFVSPNGAEAIFNRFLSHVSARRIRLWPLDSHVENRFQRIVLHLHRQSPPLVIRTFDAIHLATALEHGATEFVVTDKRLRDAATAVNLTVYP